MSELFEIAQVDYAPEDLYGQVPARANLIRQIPCADGSDYWICECLCPIQWQTEDKKQQITHLLIGARYFGQHVSMQMQQLVVGLAYVTDPSLLSDKELDLSKCEYVAIATVSTVDP